MDALVAEGYNEAMGARELRRAVTRLVDDTLSDAVLRGEVRGGCDSPCIRLAWPGLGRSGSDTLLFSRPPLPWFLACHRFFSHPPLAPFERLLAAARRRHRRAGPGRVWPAARPQQGQPGGQQHRGVTGDCLLLHHGVRQCMMMITMVNA